MKIYLDYIFLENLVINIVIILEIIVFTKAKVSLSRKICSVIIDTILSCIYVICNNYILHILFSVITLLILFRDTKVIKVIKKVLCFYLLYFIYLGLIIFTSLALRINLDMFISRIAVYIVCGIIFHILNKELWKVWKTNITSENLYYNLCINNNELSAFVDTGNSVKDPLTNLNVIFVKDNLKEKVVNSNLKRTYINISTINGCDTKEAYIANNVKVYKGKNEVAELDKIILSFTLSSDTPEKYSALLGYDTYLENLQGVRLW